MWELRAELYTRGSEGEEQSKESLKRSFIPEVTHVVERIEPTTTTL